MVKGIKGVKVIKVGGRKRLVKKIQNPGTKIQKEKYQE